MLLLNLLLQTGRLDFVNLERHAMRMSELIDRKVKFVPDICGDMAVRAIKSMKDGDIVMLDNVRFDAVSYTHLTLPTILLV